MEPWIIIVMLGAAALVYAVMLPKRQVDKISSEQVIKDMESTLEQYMADIEEENDTLVELIGQMKKDTSAKQMGLEEKLGEIKQRLLQVEQITAQQGARISDAELQQSTLKATQKDLMHVTEASDPEPSGKGSEPINSIKFRYPELFELHHSGKSVDMISQSVGLQRGEVQLILQLAKQEESV